MQDLIFYRLLPELVAQEGIGLVPTVRRLCKRALRVTSTVAFWLPYLEANRARFIEERCQLVTSETMRAFIRMHYVLIPPALLEAHGIEGVVRSKQTRRSVASGDQNVIYGTIINGPDSFIEGSLVRNGTRVNYSRNPRVSGPRGYGVRVHKSNPRVEYRLPKHVKREARRTRQGVIIERSGQTDITVVCPNTGARFVGTETKRKGTKWCAGVMRARDGTEAATKCTLGQVVATLATWRVAEE